MISLRRPYRLTLAGGRTLDLGPRTLVMGILNVTPDSFSDGGRFDRDPSRAIDAALAMVEAGADLIDVGGESTRPGAATVDAVEEQRRVLPVIRGIVRQSLVPVSIDTYKVATARAAVEAGAAMINDISGLLYEPEIGRVAANSGAALVLMHTRGRPTTMYAEATYEDVLQDVANELRTQLDVALSAGVKPEAIVIDPGIGFAKRPEQSFAVLAGLDRPPLLALDRPILAGPSRKSFLQLAIGDCPPDARVWATAAAVTAAVLAGAHMVRVHDVKEMVQAVRVADKIRSL
jgi:dihydropteroate synthase